MISKLSITVLGSGASRRVAEQGAATQALEAARRALTELPKKGRRAKKAEPAPQAKLEFSSPKTSPRVQEG